MASTAAETVMQEGSMTSNHFQDDLIYRSTYGQPAFFTA